MEYSAIVASGAASDVTIEWNNRADQSSLLHRVILFWTPWGERSCSNKALATSEALVSLCASW